jgi:hypothetical protein
VAGEVVDPLGGGIPGAAIGEEAGATIGSATGRGIGDDIDNLVGDDQASNADEDNQASSPDEENQPSCNAGTTANVATRALTEADLGVPQGSLSQLSGTYSVTNGAATVQVNMIEGNLGNPFTVINNLRSLAAGNGAQTLNIQGTIANPSLYNALSRYYNLTTQGAIDTINIPLK